jgi:hypothetical protein
MKIHLAKHLSIQDFLWARTRRILPECFVSVHIQIILSFMFNDIKNIQELKQALTNSGSVIRLKRPKNPPGGDLMSAQGLEQHIQTVTVPPSSPPALSIDTPEGRSMWARETDEGLALSGNPLYNSGPHEEDLNQRIC